MVAVSARLDDNRRIEFNASEHRHFDHGYAVTSHSSQGLTAEPFSFTPIPTSTRTCSTPVSATSPYPAPATRPRSLPTTWRNLGPIGRRCLEDIRSKNQSSLIHRPGNCARAVKMRTLERSTLSHPSYAYCFARYCKTSSLSATVHETLIKISDN